MTTNEMYVVSLSCKNWEHLLDIVKLYCAPLSRDWHNWGDSIQTIIKTSVNSSSANEEENNVKVNLSKQNCNVIITALDYRSKYSDRQTRDRNNNIKEQIFKNLTMSISERESIEEILKETSVEISQGTKSVLSYQKRAKANYDLGNYVESLEDIQQAMKLDPADSYNYYLREAIHKVNKEWEYALQDKAKYFELEGEIVVDEPDDKSSEKVMLYELSKNHLQKSMYPLIKKQKEHFLNFWFAPWIVWNRETKEVLYSGTTYNNEHGVYGGGYVCLTETTLYLISFFEWTQHVAKEIKNDKKGMGNFLYGALSRTSNYTEPAKSDQVLTLSLPTITFTEEIIDQYLTGEYPVIKIVSPATTCMVISSDMDYFLTALKGFILKANTSINQNTSEVNLTKADVIGLLKELGKLKDQGIITDEEFLNKKKELLSRI